MRGLLLIIVFFGALPLVFLKTPFVGVLMWFWISLMNPHQLTWGSFSSLPYALIVAVATLLSLTFSPREPKLPPADKTTVLLLLMMAWTSVTSVFGLGFPATIYDMWLAAEKMLLMTLVGYMLTTSRDRLDLLIVVCAFSLAFFGAKGGLFSLATGATNHVLGPEDSQIADNNDLGVALTMVLPLLFYIRERYRETFPRLKWPMLGFIGLTFLGDIFTYSRGAFLAISAMAGMLWLRSRQKIWFGLLIALGVAGIVAFAPGQWFERMSTIQSYETDASAESRLYLWRLSWEMALKHPITGAGYRWSYDPSMVNRELADIGLPRLTRARAPHSIWFQILGEHGFVGLAIFIAFLISLALDAQWLIRRSRGDPELAWANNLGRMLQVSLVGYCVGGTFVTLAMYDGFYAVVIIAASARRVVAAELARRSAVAAAGTLAIARSGAPLRPQPAG
jgi:probable O-glycosylation ligase (exosortase A-associated)